MINKISLIQPNNKIYIQNNNTKIKFSGENNTAKKELNKEVQKLTTISLLAGIAMGGLAVSESKLSIKMLLGIVVAGIATLLTLPHFKFIADEIDVTKKQNGSK